MVRLKVQHTPEGAEAEPSSQAPEAQVWKGAEVHVSCSTDQLQWFKEQARPSRLKLDVAVMQLILLLLSLGGS